MSEVRSQSKAFHRALKFLESRPRSTKEVEGRLVRYGYKKRIIDAVVADLKRLEYLDDRAFVRMWIEEKIKKAYGEQRIMSELLTKIPNRALIKEELEQIYNPEDDLARALTLAQKRMMRYGYLDPATAQRRLAQFLVRRGYPSGVTREVCMEIFGNQEA